IEVATNPFLEFSVSLMSGIADCVHEFGVAPGATAIFGRAASGRCDQARIECAWLGIGEPLAVDRVLPAIAKIVDVPQRLRAGVFDHVVEMRLASIKKAFGPIGFWIERAPSNIAGTNLIEMTVGPTQGGRDGQVQPVEPDVERHLDAA